MRALPARRIAFGALCAALLAGTTGPAAMAADSAPERDRAASSAELLTQVRNVDAHGSELAPVVDLVNAVLAADGGQLPPDRARKLGDAARAAVARAADDDPATTITMTTVTTNTTTSGTTTPATTPAVTAPATDVLLPAAETADLTSGALDAVREALDSLLALLLPKDDTATADETTDETTEETTDETTTQEPSSADDLLTRMDELIEALTGADLQVSTLPAPAEATPSTSTTPATLPALTSLLLPTS